jgi:hypothetical protein
MCFGLDGQPDIILNELAKLDPNREELEELGINYKTDESLINELDFRR